jgi:hypothetical protein
MNDDIACPNAEVVKRKGCPATLMQNDDGTYRVKVELALD